jgi:hypothetical protein
MPVTNRKNAGKDHDNGESVDENYQILDTVTCKVKII